MPLYIVLGHGTFHASDGYMTLPDNVQIDFFVPDGSGLDDNVANSLEFHIQDTDADLSPGLSDDAVLRTRRQYEGQRYNRLKRLSALPGTAVKNYRLESVLNATTGANYRSALEKSNVLTPGKRTNDDSLVSSLQSLTLEVLERHAGDGDMIRIEWVACRSARPHPK